ncbi:hypothetical protein Acsp03_43200 [Actinomadura sp. NBRC 104412]|uniref:luciferase domain-containing protein n=1 Tax=Actinomadura sp. NBRC 104412 TaxID=3032203 RepID=UPI0024A20146|nr:luciferase family protein [Actinomadura sp. NBRC 104412]GLZ06854.1 hypothetical protein Acsp03_43200 [Actinomadura sp. NBRC 104412]
MAANGSGATSQAGLIADRLREWHGVSKVRADCGVGIALATAGRQFLHLHSDESAELRLTRPVVERLGAVLGSLGTVAIQPRGEWITVRLETGSDVGLVVSLASVAIKANATALAPGGGVPCSAAAGGIPPERLAKLFTAGPGGSPMPLSQFPLLTRGAPREDAERSG